MNQPALSQSAAQISSLLYRRIPFGGLGSGRGRGEFAQRADWKSATQPVGNRRYEKTAASSATPALRKEAP